MATSDSTPVRKDIRNRHLVQRRRTWFYQRGIPAQHQEALGSRIFCRTLSTSDLRIARQRRDRLNVEFDAMLASLEPAVDVWTPKGVIQTASYIRLHGKPEQVETEVARIAAAQPVPMAVEDPALVDAVRKADRLVNGTPGALLSDAVNDHLDLFARSVRASTVSARRKTLEGLTAFLGDPAAADVSRRDLAKWVSDEVLPSGLATKSMINRVSDVINFGDWCVTAGVWPDNHAAKLTRLVRESKRGKEQTGVRPWTVAEVNTLRGYMAETLKADDPLHLLVDVALHTGARIEEICRLTGGDIETIDGVPCFRIREGKTSAALRAVPIHSALLPLVAGLGADEFLIKGTKATGPDGRRSAALVLRFGKLKRRAGYGPELVFHGFRRTVAQRLESAGVPVSTTETLLGHKRSSMSYGVYSDKADMDVLADAVERISYSEAL